MPRFSLPTTLVAARSKSSPSPRPVLVPQPRRLPYVEPNWTNDDNRPVSEAAVDRAKCELEAYFAGTIDADARKTVEETLSTLANPDRGILALRFTPRAWPVRMAHHYGADAPIVLRLFCLRHPCAGSPAAVEQAAIARIEAALGGDTGDDLSGLAIRADELGDDAIEVYARAMRKRARPAR